MPSFGAGVVDCIRELNEKLSRRLPRMLFPGDLYDNAGDWGDNQTIIIIALPMPLRIIMN